MRYLTAVLLLVASIQAYAVSTLSYQGQLLGSDGPVNDTVAMSFALFSAQTGGTQVGPTINLSEVNVVNGLFQVGLDFGVQPYASGLWLAITIEGELLSPRQPITGAPFAIDMEPEDPPAPPDPPDPQDCEDYCNAMMIGCVGEYPSTQQCLDTCAGFSGEGEIGDLSGNTLQCRSTWLQRGFEGEIPIQQACTNAAADSPVCVD